MMDELAGRTAVITGAASGLGRAMAERMAAEGMRLVLADIEPGPLEDVAPTHSATAATEVVTQLVDVAAPRTSIASPTSRSTASAPSTCCATTPASSSAPGRGTSRVDDWHWVLGVDLWSVIHAVRAFVPRMLGQAEGGHIVNTASMSGLLPIPNLAAYSVAKAAVVALSEALQLDLDAEGARSACRCCARASSPRGSPRASATGRPSSPTRRRCPAVARTTAGVEATMDAAEVAGHVVDAIRANRFWILTHDAYRDVIQERAAASGPTPARRRHRSGDRAAERSPSGAGESCRRPGAIGTMPSVWNRT